VDAVVAEADVLIVTVDDDVRDMATKLFTRAGFATVDVRTGEEALSAAVRRRPSLVLLDPELADMTGYEVCYELRERTGQDLPIIFVSGERTKSSDRVAGLLIGADDYVSKPFDPDELLARARRILARVPCPTETMDTPLTGREIQILQLLADGSSQGAIAKELFISSKTVASHIQRTLTKLGVHSRTEAVALAYQDGLVRGRPTKTADAARHFP
jgi:two-component system, NarL family, nitrate/nitrite response regulator NarL